jgi:DNA (cytosine-5)-methyltransferase 1
MNAADLFAGLGGFTEGAESAGIRVVYAANHWPVAVDWHRRNHPRVLHSCQDLRQADFHDLPDFDILLASPSCQGHSPARGKDQPRHDASRSTAWAVVDCAEAKRPAIIVCENVPAWTKWVLWPAWCEAMRALGYTLSPHILNAADFGVPQERVRLILVASRSKAPLILKPRRAAHQPVAAIIDWDRGDWPVISRRRFRPRSFARIQAGRREHGERFVAPYYSRGSGMTGRSVDRPIGTLTTKDRWLIVKGNRARFLSVAESRRAMSFPDTYLLPPQVQLAKHLLGNAIPPLMASRVLDEIRRAA